MIQHMLNTQTHTQHTHTHTHTHAHTETIYLSGSVWGKRENESIEENSDTNINEYRLIYIENYHDDHQSFPLFL